MKAPVKFIFAIGIILGLIYIGIWTFNRIPSSWIPVIAGGVGFLISRFYESWKENKQRLYDKKREVYSVLLRPYINILTNSMMNKAIGTNRTENVTEEMFETAIQAGFDSILYASDDVVKAYGIFRNMQLTNPTSTKVLFSNLSQLLRAMRKDLGHTWTNLSDREMLAIFINLTPQEWAEYGNLK